jgi:hypothetical protein
MTERAYQRDSWPNPLPTNRLVCIKIHERVSLPVGLLLAAAVLAREMFVRRRIEYRSGLRETG